MTLKECASLLREAGIEDALFEARLLFSRFGNIAPYQLISGDVRCEREELMSAVKRRQAREPLQYILGEVDFYHESYEVTPDCLIPRQDTELLVDYAVKHIPEGERFLDLCTGSGCVAISTLKNTERTTAIAFELFPRTAALAERNAERNGVGDRLEVITVDLMKDAPTVGGVFAVLSNPPYVSESVYTELQSEIFHEPMAAFVGGEDGGDFYRRFVPIYKEMIADEGFMAFEIGFDQRGLLLALAEENGLSAEIIKDLSGNDRVAVLRRR